MLISHSQEMKLDSIVEQKTFLDEYLPIPQNTQGGQVQDRLLKIDDYDQSHLVKEQPSQYLSKQRVQILSEISVDSQSETSQKVKSYKYQIINSRILLQLDPE